MNKKDYSISFIRMISTIMIIACHFLQYYKLELAFWLNVGVQIFLCISGYLYGQKEIENSLHFIKKNCLKILLDYYIFIFVMIIIYGIFATDLVNLNAIINIFLCRSTFDSLGHLWFISCIIFCYLITPFLHRIEREMANYNDKVYIICLCFLLIIVEIFFRSYIQIINPSWINCYILGYFIGKLKISPRVYTVNNIIIIFLPVTILINSIRIFLVYFSEIKFQGIFALIFKVYCFYAHTMLGITIFLILYSISKKIQLLKLKKILLISDKYSYDIFIVHNIFIQGRFNLQMMTSNIVINIFIIIIAIILAAVLLEKTRTFIYWKLEKIDIFQRTT